MKEKECLETYYGIINITSWILSAGWVFFAIILPLRKLIGLTTVSWFVALLPAILIISICIFLVSAMLYINQKYKKSEKGESNA